MSAGSASVEQLTHDLGTVLELGEGRLAPAEHAAVAELHARVGQRLAIGDGLTVVALAGGTGVGKSALCNALVGTEVAQVGTRRPTTGHAVAVSSGLDPPTVALLDWLGIDDRRVLPDGVAAGLVLVDLPDHDSVVTGHRAVSDRLAARVDALVVVVDPVKYARADLHHGPLAALRHHAEVLLVALNRADELPPDDLATVRSDLLRRLEGDGLGDAGVYVTSAVTGEGVDELRGELEELSRSRRAVLQRLTADAAGAAAAARAHLPSLPEVPVDADEVVDAVLAAADGHRAVVAHTVAWRHAAGRALRSPLARLARAPVAAARRAGRELGLTGIAADEQRHTTPTRSEEAIARTLAEQLALADTTGLTHQALDRAVRDAAAQAAPHAVAAVRQTRQQEPARRWWWPVLAGLRGVAEAVALTGLVWSVLLGVAGWLALPEPPTPALTETLDWPAALLLGGLGARLLLGVCSRWSIRVGARGVARRTERRLRQQLAASVARHLIAPYQREVATYRELHSALGRLAGNGTAGELTRGRGRGPRAGPRRPPDRPTGGSPRR